MTREQAISAALAELDRMGVKNLKSREPVTVKERKSRAPGDPKAHRWCLTFWVDLPPEIEEHSVLIVDVYDSSGEVVVHPTL